MKHLHTFFLLIAFFFFSCQEKNKSVSNIVIVNPKIKNFQIFKKMYSEMDFLEPQNEPNQSRSSSVVYLTDEKINFEDSLKTNSFESGRHNSCYSFFQYNSDTLVMRFGEVNCLLLLFKNNKFKISPYISSCTPDFGKRKLKINYQKLILNKDNYKEGDSIYGFVECSILEKKENSVKSIEHFAKGYFKSKVKNPFKEKSIEF